MFGLRYHHMHDSLNCLLNSKAAPLNITLRSSQAYQTKQRNLIFLIDSIIEFIYVYFQYMSI